jgi:hypothetical protein
MQLFRSVIAMRTSRGSRSATGEQHRSKPEFTFLIARLGCHSLAVVGDLIDSVRGGNRELLCHRCHKHRYSHSIWSYIIYLFHHRLIVTCHRSINNVSRWSRFRQESDGATRLL